MLSSYIKVTFQIVYIINKKPKNIKDKNNKHLPTLNLEDAYFKLYKLLFKNSIFYMVTNETY